MNRTAQRTIQILELLAKNADGLTLTDVYKDLEIPKTSAYDILQTLVDLDMATLKDPNFKKFGIGIKAFEIGSSYIKNNELIDIVERPLKELADNINRTIFIGTEHEGEVTYLNKYEPKKAIITTASLGSRNPVYCTGLGKAILAAYSEDKSEKIINKLIFKARTKNTIINKETLVKELSTIRDCGYAVDDRELEEHMFCLAAPIYNHNNEVIAAISTSGLYDEKLDVEDKGKLISKTALEISRKLGYMKDKLY